MPVAATQGRGALPVAACSSRQSSQKPAATGSYRQLPAPKMFFSRFSAGQIGKQTTKFSNSSSSKPHLGPSLLKEKVRTDPGASSQIKPNQASGEYSSECTK